MNFGVYSCYNVLSERHESLHSFVTDAMASARLSVHLAHISDLSEWRIYKVGEIDVQTMELKPLPHSLIPVINRNQTDITV